MFLTGHRVYFDFKFILSLNFNKVQKIDNQCEMVPPLHEKMADIIFSNFTSRISQTTSKEIEKNFLLPSNCPLSTPLVNSELWIIMSSNQRKGDVKLATLQKPLVKVVAGALNIFTEIQKDKFEIQTIAQMVADITAVVGKVLYDLSFKRRELIKSSLKLEFRSLCSANNESTELLFRDDLTKHVKDLPMTNKLRRSEGYYQSKYSNNEYSKDYAKSYSRQSFLGRGRGSLPKKSWKTREASHKKY